MTEYRRITDISSPETDLFAKLTEHQLRGYYAPEEGLFIAESSKVITRALDAGYQPELLLLEEALEETEEARELIEKIEERIAAHWAACPSAKPFNKPFKICIAPHRVMEQIIGYKLTKGILCAMRRRPLPTLEQILENAHRIAVLENVVNPTNLGAIFRSAAALSFDAVILSPYCADPLYRRASRVSMGTVFQVPWTILPRELPGELSGKLPGKLPGELSGKLPGELAGEKSGETFWPGPAMQILRERGFLTVAMALRDDTLSLEDLLLVNADKLAVLLGAEGDGLTAETIALCDYTVTIPMAEGVDSLNVAAASAVVFWAVRRRGGILGDAPERVTY